MQRLSDEIGQFASSLSAATTQLRELGAHVFDIFYRITSIYFTTQLKGVSGGHDRDRTCDANHVTNSRVKSKRKGR